MVWSTHDPNHPSNRLKQKLKKKRSRQQKIKTFLEKNLESLNFPKGAHRKKRTLEEHLTEDSDEESADESSGDEEEYNKIKTQNLEPIDALSNLKETIKGRVKFSDNDTMPISARTRKAKKQRIRRIQYRKKGKEKRRKINELLKDLDSRKICAIYYKEAITNNPNDEERVAFQEAYQIVQLLQLSQTKMAHVVSPENSHCFYQIYVILCIELHSCGVIKTQI